MQGINLDWSQFQKENERKTTLKEILERAGKFENELNIRCFGGIAVNLAMILVLRLSRIFSFFGDMH